MRARIVALWVSVAVAVAVAVGVPGSAQAATTGGTQTSQVKVGHAPADVAKRPIYFTSYVGTFTTLRECAAAGKVYNTYPNVVKTQCLHNNPHPGWNLWATILLP
jgi:hypothetical protein